MIVRTTLATVRPRCLNQTTRAIALLAAAAGPVCAGDTLFLNPAGQFQARATLSSNGNNAFLPFTAPGPGAGPVTANAGPLVWSTIEYTLTETSGQSRLDYLFSHTCSYPLGALQRGETYSDARFSAASGTTYAIGGVLDTPLGQPTADYRVEVSLFAAPGGLVFQHQTTRSIAGGSSILVGSAIPGDTLIGSPTGTLSAGVVYTIAVTIRTESTLTVPIVSSGGIHMTLSAPCYANCDGSTTPPILNVIDFACFLNRFAAGESTANCDGSTTPPTLNVLDFACFLNAFAAGC